VICGLLVLIP